MTFTARWMMIFHALALAASGGADPVILQSGERAGDSDAKSMGQCFTLTGSIEITSVEVFARRTYGGSAFTVTIQPYEPWTKTKGAEIATVTVPLQDVPSAPEGGWVEVAFASPVPLAAPGIYVFFLDSLSPGGKAGYNNYGFARGDSIEGGHRVGISGNLSEIAFRLRGTAPEGAFVPEPLPPLHLPPPVVKKDHRGKEWTYTWDSHPGHVYRLRQSSDMKFWLSTDYLGTGSPLSVSRDDYYYKRPSEFRYLEVIRLGDYKK